MDRVWALVSRELLVSPSSLIYYLGKPWEGHAASLNLFPHLESDVIIPSISFLPRLVGKSNGKKLLGTVGLWGLNFWLILNLGDSGVVSQKRMVGYQTFLEHESKEKQIIRNQNWSNTEQEMSLEQSINLKEM